MISNNQMCVSCMCTTIRRTQKSCVQLHHKCVYIVLQDTKLVDDSTVENGFVHQWMNENANSRKANRRKRARDLYEILSIFFSLAIRFGFVFFSSFLVFFSFVLHFMCALCEVQPQTVAVWAYKSYSIFHSHNFICSHTWCVYHGPHAVEQRIFNVFAWCMFVHTSSETKIFTIDVLRYNYFRFAVVRFESRIRKPAI